jgi:SNF2 family DNA or RNA helicase
MLMRRGLAIMLVLLAIRPAAALDVSHLRAESIQQELHDLQSQHISMEHLLSSAPQLLGYAQADVDNAQTELVACQRVHSPRFCMRGPAGKHMEIAKRWYEREIAQRDNVQRDLRNNEVQQDKLWAIVQTLNAKLAQQAKQ